MLLGKSQVVDGALSPYDDVRLDSAVVYEVGIVRAVDLVARFLELQQDMSGGGFSYK